MDRKIYGSRAQWSPQVFFIHTDNQETEISLYPSPQEVKGHSICFTSNFIPNMFSKVSISSVLSVLVAVRVLYYICYMFFVTVHLKMIA